MAAIANIEPNRELPTLLKLHRRFSGTLLRLAYYTTKWIRAGSPTSTKLLAPATPKYGRNVDTPLTVARESAFSKTREFAANKHTRDNLTDSWRQTNHVLIEMSAERLGIGLLTADERDSPRLPDFRALQWQ